MMKITTILTAIAALNIGTTDAAEITTSPTAPAVDGLDIANLVTPTGAEYVWSDRPLQGQTFTTGADGGTLNAITVLLWEPVEDVPIEGWKDYTLRIGTVDTSGDPDTITAAVNEVARHDPDEPADTYFTLTLDTPMPLSPNTLYGFDVGISNSQEGWQNGITRVRTSGDEYADGQRYSGARPADPPTPNISLQSGDMIFHLDIGAGTPPETDPAITSITSVDGETWELTLVGEASTGYQFYSSTGLSFDPGTLVTTLSQNDPDNDLGTVTGGDLLTTDGDGNGIVRMTLTGDPTDFVRAQSAP